MDITLYRAEPATESLSSATPRTRRGSQRLPGNVAYVVDNLWEYLRPPTMPCRRHAVYASPTRALARANLSADDKGSSAVVYRVVISGPATVAQLKVSAARLHQDNSRIRRLVRERIGALQGAAPAERREMGVLFWPGASAAEWADMIDKSALGRKFVDDMTAVSTFWADATNFPAHEAGELFFELGPGASFVAVDLQPA